MPAQPQILIQSIKYVTIVDFVSRHLRELAEIERIGEALYDLVDNRNVTKLILDLSKVQILSTQALGVFIKLREKVGQANSTMVFCGVNQNLHRLFKISQLAKLFAFYDDEESALALFGVTTAG
jgi:anti-anti-sigma factor